MANAKADEEFANHVVAPPPPPTIDTLQIMEAAALLSLWSVLVINEGAIRFMNSVPSELGRTPFPTGPAPGVLFAGGLVEVIFGLIGLAIGIGAFILRWYSTLATKAAMVIQTLLGYYVFVVFVFVQPAMRADALDGVDEAALPLGLSLGANKAIITMGILTSFHFCLALQGGQFLFMARLITAATGEDFLMQKSGNQMRGIFWNVNFALSGLWTLITGAIVRNELGVGELDVGFFNSPPNVGALPALTIFVGLVMLLWGVLGAAMAALRLAPTAYFALTGIVYLLAFLNFGIAQFGNLLLPAPVRDPIAVGGAPSIFGGPVALHNGLVFMVVFLGPYFVYKSYKEHEVEK